MSNTHGPSYCTATHPALPPTWDVGSGQPDLYVKDLPGTMMGCSPTTPGPLQLKRGCALRRCDHPSAPTPNKQSDSAQAHCGHAQQPLANNTRREQCGASAHRTSSTLPLPSMTTLRVQGGTVSPTTLVREPSGTASQTQRGVTVQSCPHRASHRACRKPSEAACTCKRAIAYQCLFLSCTIRSLWLVMVMW